MLICVISVCAVSVLETLRIKGKYRVFEKHRGDLFCANIDAERSVQRLSRYHGEKAGHESYRIPQ